MIIHDSFTNVVSTTHSLCIKFKTSFTKSRPQKQTLSLYVKNKITEQWVLCFPSEKHIEERET